MMFIILYCAIDNKLQLFILKENNWRKTKEARTEQRVFLRPFIMPCTVFYSLSPQNYACGTSFFCKLLLWLSLQDSEDQYLSGVYLLINVMLLM